MFCTNNISLYHLNLCFGHLCFNNKTNSEIILNLLFDNPDQATLCFYLLKKICLITDEISSTRIGFVLEKSITRLAKSPKSYNYMEIVVNFVINIGLQSKVAAQYIFKNNDKMKIVLEKLEDIESIYKKNLDQYSAKMKMDRMREDDESNVTSNDYLDFIKKITSLKEQMIKLMKGKVDKELIEDNDEINYLEYKYRNGETIKIKSSK